MDTNFNNTIRLSDHDNVVVARTELEIGMLVNDPRLAYVALTRAKYNLFPRVVRDGLLPSMLKHPDYSGLASQYMLMFPAERKVKGKKVFFS
mgnify:CR=1 FL=1